MRTVRLPLLRGALFIIALAAISILLMARGDNPAQAYTPHPLTYDPSFAVSVSDSNPGANADLIINFSVDAPDSFPNVKTDSSIQFIPRQWGIHVPETEEEMLARVGGIAGSFNAQTYLGVMGISPCFFPIPVSFTMWDSSIDTSVTTSALDIGGDIHPGGPGYSGQFNADPDTTQQPADLGLPLIRFNANEMTTDPSGLITPGLRAALAYRDVDGNRVISVGDVRLTDLTGGIGGVDVIIYPAGSVVQEGDTDVVGLPHSLNAFVSAVKHSEINVNGQMDPGEMIYNDKNQAWRNIVSYGDVRLLPFGHLPWLSVVQLFQLPGGVTHYPDFLNEMFPPDVVGQPLARMFGARQVMTTAVSLNIVTYRPGQLLGFPAALGYPNIVVLLNPIAPIEAFAINQTSDMCTPLSLVSTTLGISEDNPATLANEGGYARLTNPKSEKNHDFTLVTTSQPDADGDGIENMLDACPFDANVNDDSRNSIDASGDPDQDGLDAACDPQEEPPPDLGRALVSFQANEKRYPDIGNWYGAGGPSAYRDNDNSRNITPGDDRLTVRMKDAWLGINTPLPPGVVLDSDADYRNPATGAVRPAWVRGLRSFNANEKHAENVAANGLYDVGEDIYQDNDGSNDVSVMDWRLFYEGSDVPTDVDPAVYYLGTSKNGPILGLPDEDQDNFGNRADNCALTPNGILLLGVAYQQVPGFTFFYGVTTGELIGPDNQADTDRDDIGDACEGSEHGGQCLDAEDSDEDGVINDGCPVNPPQITATPESGDQCLNATDDDGDFYVNDGCPARPNEESGDQCLNDWDDEGDTWVNDGCPAVGAAESTHFGSPPCSNNIDDDGDGYVNDGCPKMPQWRDDAEGLQLSQPFCSNEADDDQDGYVNDGCPAAPTVGVAESGDQCNNATDDDYDGLVNDGCPAVDPGDYAKTHMTGEMVVRTLTQGVPIARHGIKLDDLDGPERVALDGSGSYRVALENKTGSAAEEIQVALRVVEGCGVVTGPSSVHANEDASVNADFTVDWTDCAAGEYTVQADACHAGDPAPNGFFGAGACPGASDVPGVPAQLSPSGATASSEAMGPAYGAAKAIDNDASTLWCTDFAPGVNIQASFASPVSVDRVDIEDSYGGWGYAFVTGTLSFSNGYSQDVTLTAGAGSFSVPLQSGVEWVKFTATTDAGAGAGCISELKIFGVVFPVGDTNLLDDAPVAMTVKVGTP